ncbi:MAG: putative cyclic di-GMP phosphodiesterase PdeB [Herbaspirillum frisingense]|uniref:Putative cyclic di-GMP phosphodiesterase PdeB n=1 Tax=Herbaspirillum frisingense TaxID=92645 RepID=A0A7V8FY03_9BURK|nr:MAG: putative cyclic di-GMP phosphodiesterase PdeB [Herbaspirillum frisingense]
MLTDQYGEHNALLNRGQFTDLMVDQGVRLALGRTGGLVLADSGSPDGALVQDILAGKPFTADSPYLYAAASRDGWTAMAIGDKNGAGSVSRSVIAHIIEMAKSLNLFIVAEGVEHQEQADYLAAGGVDFVQGWLYAKAMPAGDFLAYCRKAAQARAPAVEATC